MVQQRGVGVEGHDVIQDVPNQDPFVNMAGDRCLQVEDAAEQLSKRSFIERGGFALLTGSAWELPGSHTLTLQKADMEAPQLVLALPEDIHALAGFHDLDDYLDNAAIQHDDTLIMFESIFEGVFLQQLYQHRAEFCQDAIRQRP